MRTIDVLVASALLGVAIGTLLDEPGAAGNHDTMAAPAPVASTCDRRFCESMTWLRTPVLRRAPASK